MFSGREDGIIPYPLTDYMYPSCRFSTQLNSTHIGCRHCRLDNFLSSFGGSVFPKCSGWLYMITVVPLALFVPHGAFWMHSFDIFLKQKQVANTGKRWEEILSSFPYVSYLFRMFYETAKCQGQAHRQVQSPVARSRRQRWSLGCRGRKTQGAGVLDVLEFCRFRLDFQALLLRRIYMNLQQYYTVIMRSIYLLWSFVSIRSLSQEYGKERNTDFPVPGECLRDMPLSRQSWSWLRLVLQLLKQRRLWLLQKQPQKVGLSKLLQVAKLKAVFLMIF